MNNPTKEEIEVADILAAMAPKQSPEAEAAWRKFPQELAPIQPAEVCEAEEAEQVFAA